MVIVKPTYHSKLQQLQQKGTLKLVNLSEMVFDPGLVELQPIVSELALDVSNALSGWRCISAAGLVLKAGIP